MHSDFHTCIPAVISIQQLWPHIPAMLTAYVSMNAYRLRHFAHTKGGRKSCETAPTGFDQIIPSLSHVPRVQAAQRYLNESQIIVFPVLVKIFDFYSQVSRNLAHLLIPGERCIGIKCSHCIPQGQGPCRQAHVLKTEKATPPIQVLETLKPDRRRWLDFDSCALWYTEFAVHSCVWVITCPCQSPSRSFHSIQAQLSWSSSMCSAHRYRE